MANTYVLIASVTVGNGGAANIEFTNIPNTYTDLEIRTSLRTDRTSSVRDVAKVQFNSNTGTNYSNIELYGTGSAASSAIESNQTSSRYAYPTATSATANTFSNDLFYLPNYAGSTNKPFSSSSAPETNATAQDIVVIAGLWRQTSAITSIKIFPAFGTEFDEYSTATLYGIKKD